MREQVAVLLALAPCHLKSTRTYARTHVRTYTQITPTPTCDIDMRAGAHQRQQNSWRRNSHLAHTPLKYPVIKYTFIAAERSSVLTSSADETHARTHTHTHACMHARACVYVHVLSERVCCRSITFFYQTKKNKNRQNVVWLSTVGSNLQRQPYRKAPAGLLRPPPAVPRRAFNLWRCAAFWLTSSSSIFIRRSSCPCESLATACKIWVRTDDVVSSGSVSGSS